VSWKVLEGCALWWSWKGKEIPDVEVAWGSVLSLADGNFENRGDMGNPSFQSNSRELEAIRQSNSLVNRRAVMVEKLLGQAVDVASFGKEKCSCIRGSVRRGVVEVSVTGGPLGTRCLLEEMRPLFHEKACLIPVAGVAEFGRMYVVVRTLRSECI
jgi:hypothetical protein